MARTDQTLAALDIGTATVRAVIASRAPGQGIQILGVGSKPSEGVRKSTICDSAKATAVIRAAIEDAERDAHREVAAVCVGIGGCHVHSGSADAVVNLKENEDTVSQHHLDGLFENARTNAGEKGREFLHVVPAEYRINGHRGNQNPLGLQASRVQLIAHMITADRTIMENHARAVNEAGFKVSNLCFPVIADGHAILTDQEKRDGVLIVDIGAGTTSYAVYFNNSICHSRVFAVGGDHVTNDISLGIQLPYPDAENLKCTYGRLIRINEARQDPNVLHIKTADKKERIVPRKDIDLIIDSRMEEILRFVYDDIDQQCRSLLACGVVFVGGGTMVHKFAERAEKIFSMHVRIGIPRILAPNDSAHPTDLCAERHEFIRDTTFSTVLGLVKYGFQNQHAAARQGGGLFGRLFKVFSSA